MYQRCTFITLKLARISIPQTFGSFPCRGQLKHSLSLCQPLPTPSGVTTILLSCSIGAYKSAVQLLGTWKENNNSLAVITHIHTKTKPGSWFYFSLLLSSYELLGSEGWFNLPPIVSAVSHLWSRKAQENGIWPCLGGASMLLQMVSSSGKQPVPVGCTLEQRITAAPSLCGHQLTVPFHVGSSGSFWWDHCRHSIMMWGVSGRDSVWLLWEPKAPGQVLPHSALLPLVSQMDLIKYFSLHIHNNSLEPEAGKV